MYDDHYVHDCFARNDTLWTAEVGARITSSVVHWARASTTSGATAVVALLSR